MDPQIRYDIVEMIEGGMNPRKETEKWLKETFRKAVPKAWEDEIAKFLTKKMKEL